MNENSATPSAERAQRSHRQLLAWFEAAGGSLWGLTPSESGGLRGLHATRDIRAGQWLIRVPWSLAVTEDVARRSLAVVPRPQSSGDWSAEHWLTAFVLDTHRHGGFWSPMVDGFPRDFDSHPLHVPPSRLQWLLGSVVHGKVRAARLGMETMRHQIEQALAPAERSTEAAFRWAYSCVLSRKFNSQRLGEDARVLWPMADLLNHSAQPTACWAEEGGGLVVLAARDIAQGEAVTVSYFEQANSTVYALHGFCGEPRPCDDALIGTVDPKAPLRPDGVPTLSFFMVTADLDAAPAQALFADLHAKAGGDAAAAWSNLRDASGWQLSLLDPASPQGPTVPPDPPPMALQALHCELRVLRQYFDLARQRLAEVRPAASAFAGPDTAPADPA